MMTFDSAQQGLDFVLPLLQGGRIEQAIPHLEDLNKTYPTHPVVLYNLGLAYLHVKQFDEAVIRLKRAVQIEPTLSNAWIGIGNAYLFMRKGDQAIDAFQEALKISPDDGNAHRNLGGLLVGAGEMDQALDHLRKAFALLPKDPQTLYGLAFALEKVNNFQANEEADELYRQLIDGGSGSPLIPLAKQARTRFAKAAIKS